MEYFGFIDVLSTVIAILNSKYISVTITSMLYAMAKVSQIELFVMYLYQSELLIEQIQCFQKYVRFNL